MPGWESGRVVGIFSNALNLMSSDQKMLRQGMRSVFIKAIQSLTRLEFCGDDIFVINKSKTFSAEVINLFGDYEGQDAPGNKKTNNVAQYKLLGLIKLERILLGLEYMQHFDAVPVPPLLEAIHSILGLKAELFSKVSGDSKDKSSPIIEVEKNRDATQIKKINNPVLLSENKKKILEFISQSSHVRSKDVLGRFNFLTKRTVKRNLQELLQAGLLHKENKDTTVLYTVAKE